MKTESVITDSLLQMPIGNTAAAVQILDPRYPPAQKNPRARRKDVIQSIHAIIPIIIRRDSKTSKCYRTGPAPVTSLIFAQVSCNKCVPSTLDADVKGRRKWYACLVLVYNGHTSRYESTAHAPSSAQGMNPKLTPPLQPSITRVSCGTRSREVYAHGYKGEGEYITRHACMKDSVEHIGSTCLRL